MEVRVRGRAKAKVRDRVGGLGVRVGLGLGVVLGARLLHGVHEGPVDPHEAALDAVCQ